MGKASAEHAYRLATESQWSEARQRGGPRATPWRVARGKRTEAGLRLLQAPPSHAGCRPRCGRTGRSAPRVDCGHLGVRERGLGCLATSRGRVGQEQKSAANFQSVCHCSGGREAPPPLFADTVPRSPQRLRFQGAACWLGGHEYFLKTSMHATRDPRHTPKDTRVIQNAGRNRSKVGRRSAQHPRGKDACLASCPAVRPAAKGPSFPGRIRRRDALDRSGRPGFEWLRQSCPRARPGRMQGICIVSLQRKGLALRESVGW